MMNESEVTNGPTTGIDYSTHLGPELWDGRRITTREMADMTLEDFIDLHSISFGQDKYKIKRVIYSIALRKFRSDPTATMSDIIGIELMDARRIDGVGKRGEGIVALGRYLVEHYKIPFGTKLD